ncbi:GntR family transcriptional regulator [Nonomuraea aurantiaca]|uniref:GntR family transcriptional regulator n=1 Tax=Nonomuraea aurantiaca TaxID=2878562 RepID=UPI001CD9F926|nr:GntR family transcriptional regulator [Nonomuraea aurantiaca]MCA2227607.1 GntR family transcriptional regulator [Nonomuraea aurantiaca]
MIEFREDQPRWQQAAQVIRERIAAGVYRPGSRVPSENDLMQEFGIARMTAHKAMRALREEGAIYTVRGMGSFVSPPDTSSPSKA